MFEKTEKKYDLNNNYQQAVEAGDIEKVKSLFSPLYDLREKENDLNDEEYAELAKKVDEQIPYLDFEMVTTQGIMRAAQLANWELLEVLYDLGAELDVKITPQEWYLIHECIASAPDKVSKAIIDYANVNVQTAKGETPLMVAVKRNKEVMTSYLLESGRVDLNLRDKLGNNVAHYAALTENNNLLLILIEKGVHFLVKNKEGKTPLDLIEDESFRMSLPEHLQKIESTGTEIALNKDEAELVTSHSETEILPQSNVEEVADKPKVSGLSKIKKKS